MPIVLRISVAVFCVFLAAYVLYLVSKGRLLLKYSLLWLSLALILLLSAAFPDGIIYLAHFFGFEMTANFIFFIGLFCLMAITLSLTVIVSKQAKRISVLTQKLALVDYRVESEGGSDSNTMSSSRRRS